MQIQANSSEWNKLNQNDKDKIEAIIKSHFKNATIVAGAAPDSATFLKQGVAADKSMFLTSPWCTAACGVAEAAAVAACAVLTGPAAGICAAVAHAAGDFCRKECGP